MGVYIKGMEIPKCCGYCPIEYKNYCMIKPSLRVESADRHPRCPLIPVPPHGRLIDADKITEHKYTTIPPYRKKYADEKPKSDEEIIAFKFGWNYAIDGIVENAPTIIPESDEDINVLCKEEGE